MSSPAATSTPTAPVALRDRGSYSFRSRRRNGGGVGGEWPLAKRDAPLRLRPAPTFSPALIIRGPKECYLGPDKFLCSLDSCGD
jgi:hypothetical protein